MQVHSASEMLDVCERGLGQSRARQSLLLLQMTCPDESLSRLEQVSVGERDARLLQLRAGIFGSSFPAQIECEMCEEPLELQLDASDLLGADTSQPGGETLVGDWWVRFRLPSTADLLAVVDDDDDEVAATRLLERCIVAAQHAGHDEPARNLPPAVADAIADRIEAADRRANIQLALSCPSCEHHWTTTFDIVSFLWTELEVWARRTLREVHQLASAYGWSEQQILALSAWRRQAYLEMTAA